MNDRIPPQAKELESAILGALMLEGSAYDKVSAILKPESFYLEANQRVYRVIQALNSKCQPVDVLTVVEELIGKGELEKIGGAGYVTNLTRSVVSSANIETHARKVTEKFIKREIIKMCMDIERDGFDESVDAFELLESAEKGIMQIGSSHVHGEMQDITTVMMKTLQQIEEYRKSGSSVTGIPTGHPMLDAATRGWQKGDLIILAARPSVGKTALALNIIRNASKNTPIAVWSLEMKSYQLGLRMISAESRILLNKLQTGHMSDFDMQSMYDGAIQNLINSKIFFDDSPNVTCSMVRSKARRLKNKEGVGLIIVDFLQLLKGSNKSNRNRDQELAEIAIDLKNTAMELDVPIIAISSLNRETEKRVGGKPKISDIRESGAIEYAADLIMLLYGPSEEEIEQDVSLMDKRYLRIAKQRNGMLLTVEYDFKSEIQLYEASMGTENHSKPISPIKRDYTGDNPF